MKVNFNPFSGMSQSQSQFIKWLAGIAASFIVIMGIGLFKFVQSVSVVDAVQNKRIEQAEVKINSLEKIDKYFPSNGEFQRAVRGIDVKTQANAQEIEKVRVEVREDLKDINAKIDKLIELQLKDDRRRTN